MGQKRIIYACDVGSTRCSAKTGLPSFAWARVNPEDGAIQVSSHIDKLVQQLKSDIRQVCSIALGFEAPLFIPVPEDWKDLSKGREGDGNRSFASPVGLSVCALGIHQSAWILRSLYESLSRECDFTLDPKCWPPSGQRLVVFCWEAFVSGAAHSEQHLMDAATAVSFFHENETNLRNINAVSAEKPLSLIWSVALWSGWVSNLEFMHKPTLVIKPKEPFRGNLRKLD